MYVSMYFYEKTLFRVKPQVEELAFGGDMFENLQSYYNSLIKAHSMFSISNLQLICYI